MIKPSFKAISKETNKWVCGNLTQDNRKDYIIEWIVTEEGGIDISTEKMCSQVRFVREHL